MLEKGLSYSANEISELVRMLNEVKTKETIEIKERLDKKFKNLKYVSKSCKIALDTRC